MPDASEGLQYSVRGTGVYRRNAGLTHCVLLISSNTCGANATSNFVLMSNQPTLNFPYSRMHFACRWRTGVSR